MTDYSFYDIICRLIRITTHYKGGKSCREKLTALAEDVALKTYRVAVVGEFKRGKSSLINALLGTDILPTDVVPMTAALTRIRYSTEKKILIDFKDGRIETRTVEELEAFATKADLEHEKTAMSIREVIVEYPSVLCRNHIELLDTPGLNDTERLSELTYQVLGIVDTAIVVFSAKFPLSLTEQDLVLDLIGQAGVRHLIFVVTFMDALDDDEEKESVLAFYKERLSTTVLEKAQKRFEDDLSLLEKAQSLLCSPDIYGISSKEAAVGFRSDNDRVLKQSGIPFFKERLLTFLMAAQQKDLPAKTIQAVNDVLSLIPKWRQAEEKYLLRALDTVSEQDDDEDIRRYPVLGEINQILSEVNTNISTSELLGSLVSGKDARCSARAIFERHLNDLEAESRTHSFVYGALLRASQDVLNNINQIEEAANSRLKMEMLQAENDTYSLIQEERADQVSLQARLSSFHSSTKLPRFSWAIYPIPPVSDLAEADVRPYIEHAVDKSLEEYEKLRDKYVSDWRETIIQTIRKSVADPDTSPEQLQRKITGLPYIYEQHIADLSDMLAQLE